MAARPLCCTFVSNYAGSFVLWRQKQFVEFFLTYAVFPHWNMLAISTGLSLSLNFFHVCDCCYSSVIMGLAFSGFRFRVTVSFVEIPSLPQIRSGLMGLQMGPALSKCAQIKIGLWRILKTTSQSPPGYLATQTTTYRLASRIPLRTRHFFACFDLIWKTSKDFYWVYIVCAD